MAAVQGLRENLQRSLFPEPPPARRPLSRLEEGFLVLAFLVLAAALQLLRQDPAKLLDSLWAEDGPIFLGGAMSMGTFDAITTPYAGYLVVVQRLVGEIGHLVPLWDAPAVMNVAATLVVGITGIVVWVASAGHIRSHYLRALLVVLTLLSPVAGVESVASGTYLAWFMTFGAFWLLFWRPATIWSACLGGVFILLTGLSSPALIFFTPIALLRALAIRDRRDLPILGGFGLAVAIQLPVTMLSEGPPADSRWEPEMVTVFLQRVVDGSVLGLELGSEAWKSWGWTFLIGLTVMVALYLAVLAYRARSGRLFLLVAVATSVGMFTASLYERGITLTLLWPVGMENFLGARYAIVPCLLLISAVLVLLDRLVGQSRIWRGAAVATAAVLLLALVTSFQTAERRGPPWDDALRAAAAECRRGSPEVGIVYVTPEGMTMGIPCPQLEDAVS